MATKTMYLVMMPDDDNGEEVVGVFEHEADANKIRDLWGSYAEVKPIPLNQPRPSDYPDDQYLWEITLYDGGGEHAYKLIPYDFYQTDVIERKEPEPFMTHFEWFWLGIVWAPTKEEAIAKVRNLLAQTVLNDGQA